MKKSIRRWIVIAAALVALGSILLAGVLYRHDWNIVELSTDSYETNVYAIDEAFQQLSIRTEGAEICLALSEDGACRVECDENESTRYSVSVQADALVIDQLDAGAWQDSIGVHFGNPRIMIYLPKADYASLKIEESAGSIDVLKDFRFGGADIALGAGDVDFYASAEGSVRIKTGAGDIRMENLSAGALEIAVSTGEATISNVRCTGEIAVGATTGRVQLRDLACRSLSSTGSTGDLFMERVLADETLTLKRSTGDIHLEGCDAAEIFAETNTGSVTGSLLSDKLYIAESNTGRIEVPETLQGGRCEIKTSTGDIHFDAPTD